MPNTTSMTINDGTADTTYSKTIAQGNSVTFVDSSAETVRGQPSISVSFDPRSSRRATTKVTARISVPYEQTIDGEVLVKHTSLATVSFTIPESVPASERARLYSIVKNFLNDASMSSVISSPEAYY